MEVRRTRSDDLEKVLEVYQKAREFMAKSGNPNQWDNIPGGPFPSREVIEQDIDKDGYVVVENNDIIGAFVLIENADEKDYHDIDGAWLNDKPYGVVHRCASGGTYAGVGQFILDWCFDRTGNIRIDTHEDNNPMIKLLAKNGYTNCGKVWADGFGWREAFQKVE